MNGKNVAYAAGQSVATPETSQSGRRPGVHHGVNTARVETPHRHMGRHFPAAARPALAHPVIGGWAHDDERICRAERGVPRAIPALYNTCCGCGGADAVQIAGARELAAWRASARSIAKINSL